MVKFYEKKNLGIPVTIITLLAYFIGYSLTRSLSTTLFVAVLFAGAVFSLDFDDRVKNAVKHSYIFATLFYLLYLAFDVLEYLTSMFSGGNLPSINSFKDIFFGLGIIPRALTAICTYGMIFVNIAVVVMYGIFLLMSILNKDVNMSFVKKILGEAPAKPKNQALLAQAPAAPVNQQPAKQPAPQAPAVNQQPAQQPAQQAPAVNQQPAQQSAPAPQAPPVQEAKGTCPGCGTVNASDAKFCGSCGYKLM